MAQTFDEALQMFEAAERDVTAAAPPTTTAAQLPPSVTPETQAALGRATDAFKVTVPNSYVSPEGERMGIRPGVFLDISSGASKSTRFDIGKDENRLNQFKQLVAEFGPDNVDISEDDRFILRNQPSKGGGVEDVMVNPIGMDQGDIVEQLGQIGYLGGGGVGAWLGGLMSKNPIGRVITSSLGMAFGGLIGGSAQDAMVRFRRGGNIELGDIASHRLVQASIDAPVGILTAGVGKLGTKTVEGVLGIGQVGNASRLGGALGMKRSETQQAAKELADQTGVDYPLSPGEAAGPGTAAGRLFLRAEATASGRVGSASAIDRMLDQKQKAEDELLRVFFGFPRTMSDDELRVVMPDASEVGSQALRRLGKEADELTDATRVAQADVSATGTAEAQRMAGVNLSQRLDPTAVGSTVRGRVTGDFATQQQALGARYDSFFSRPELRARTVDGNSLARVAETVEKDLTPQALRTKEVPTGLVDEFDRPIMNEKEVVERINAFVNGSVKKSLDALKGLKGAKVGVNDLKMIRTGIDDSIAEGVAIPGVNVKQLRELRSEVTGVIGKSLDDIDPALRAEWSALNDDYAKGMARFDRKSIRDLLVKDGETGSVGSTEIAERIMGDNARAKDIYDAYKGFLGATSPEFKQLQRVVVEQSLYRSKGDTAPFIDGSRLRAGLRNLRPEIAEEILGTNQQELARIGEVLEASQGKNIDVAELRSLSRQHGGLTASKLKELIAAEDVRRGAYNNKLIKAAAEGTIDAERIRPSDFVRHASSMDPKDASKVMGVLSDRPDVVQGINRIAIDRIWAKAQAEASSSGHKLISPDMLKKVLDGANPERASVQRETWRVLAGSDAIKGLEQLVKTVAARGFNTSSFKGSLGGQGDVAHLMLKGEIGMLPEVAHRWLIAAAYSGPLKRATTNLIVSQDRGRFLNALIGSVPFVQETLEAFGPETGAALMGYYRGMVEPEQKKELFLQGKMRDGVDPKTLTEEEATRFLENSLAQ